MRHFFTGRIRLILALAVILAVVLGVASNLTGRDYPGILVQSVLSPIRAGADSLVRQAEKFYSYMFRYEALEAENAALRQQIAQMREDARNADTVSRENDRLRALLDMQSLHEDYTLLDCYIISRDSVDWAGGFTLNRGASSGVEEGMCVITANSEVVGIIEEVGPNYSRVRTVLDSTLEISATIASSGYNGMVRGDYTGGYADLMRMDYLPTSAVIRNQDQVVTSGSSMYPKNLILGYVVDAGFSDTGVAKYAILTPAVVFGQLEQVFILTSFETAD